MNKYNIYTAFPSYRCLFFASFLTTDFIELREKFMSVSIKVQACTSGRNIKKYVNVWSYIILELIQYRWRKQTILKKKKNSQYIKKKIITKNKCHNRE